MRPSEQLTTLALLALSAATAAAGAPGTGVRLVALAAMLWVGWALARRGATDGLLGACRDFGPVAVVLLVFLLLQPVIEGLNPARYDGPLAAFDRRWLGWLVPGWRGALGRPSAFTDVAYVAYCSFYLLPVTVGVVVWRWRGPAALERVRLAVLLGFYLSFLGYFLWPASGPRVDPAQEAAVLGGGVISELARGFLRGAETTTLDAFPSGHTAQAVVASVLGARLLPRAGPALLAWAATVIFSTVYISAHYAVDVLAGLALAGLTLGLAPAVDRWLGPAPEGAQALDGRDAALR
jgi:membrane-associated phospholipid phosphatase